MTQVKLNKKPRWGPEVIRALDEDGITLDEFANAPHAFRHAYSKAVRQGWYRPTDPNKYANGALPQTGRGRRPVE